MQDRIPTQVLENGAIRYAIYDGNGNFLRYEWILPADEPTGPWTYLSKSTLLKDTTAALMGLTSDSVPDDALKFLAETVSGLKTNAVHIASGSYEGTGSISNPVSLTFDFLPKYAVILPMSTSYLYAGYWVYDSKLFMGNWVGGSVSNYMGTVTRNGNTLTFRSGNSADNSLNRAGTTYCYVAFG